MPNISDNDIEPIPPSTEGAKKKVDKASRYLKFAKGVEAIKGGEEIIYTTIYDAARIGCDAILNFFGYRVKKSGQNYHYKVIDIASQLVNGELKLEFIRLQKMRQKRNKLEYGDSSPISEQELKQAYDDAIKLIKLAGRLINEKDEKLNSKLL